MSEPQRIAFSLSNRASKCLAGLLALLCLGPLLVTTGSLFSGAPEERTNPGVPHNFGQLIRWPGKFKYHFEEHFGFREELIAAHGRVMVDLLGVSSNPKVILGKDDWLFLAAEGILDYSRGKDLFSPSQVNAWIQSLEERETWLRARGIPFLFMIAPNKHTIYPEYLPEGLAPLARETRADQLISGLPENINVLDLRPALQRAKERYRVFHNTDSHWNLLAGKMASDLVVSWSQGKGTDELELNLGLIHQEKRPAGDLGRMLGLKKTRWEDDLIPDDYEPARAPNGSVVPDNHLDVRGDRLVITENENATGSLLVFSDSFGQAMVPWMAKHFRRVVWVRSYALDRQLVDEEKPDIVILQLVERKLQTVSPDGEVGEP